MEVRNTGTEQYTQSLKVKARSEWQLSREVHRPWGSIFYLDIGKKQNELRLIHASN